MEKWEENLDKDIDKYKKREKGYFIFIAVILIFFIIIALIIIFFTVFWPGIFFMILGGNKS